MPELVIMPPSPNKPPQAAAAASLQSGKRPAPPPELSNKRLSIKDYFSVMDPPAGALAGSKKRKSTGDVGPVAKKPKAKPASAKTKKGGEPTQSSDKENGINADTLIVSDGEAITTTTTTTAPAKLKAPRKPRALKDGTAKKKVDKGKEKADQEAEDAALAAQLAREEATATATATTATATATAATAASGVSAPGFQAVNIFKVSMGEKACHTFKTMNPVGEVIKVKAKLEKEKKAKEPKVPKPKPEPKKKTPKPPKESTAPKEPKVPKEPKAPKEPKPPKQPKEKVPKADAPPKEKKEKPPKPVGETKKSGPKPKEKGTATGIKEWKQYEPKSIATPAAGLAAAGGIAKFLQQSAPVEMVKAPPKLEPCPELEHIEISYSLGVIHDRLVIREFFLRFEKSLKIVPKYINTVNNPNSDWTDLTYRSIIVCLLRLLHTDNHPIISWDILDAGIKEIEKTAPDDLKLWLCLTTTLHGFFDEEVYVGADWTQHKPRLQLIVRLIALAMGSWIVRDRIEGDAGLLKKEEKSAQEQIKGVKAEWEMNKQEIGKARLTAQGEERERLERKLKGETAFMKSQVALVEARSWFKKRKLQPRQRPLGVDARGNTYWLFVQREKNSEDWGRWIVIERALDLPHPSGSIPPHLLLPPAPSPQSSETEDDIQEEPPTEEIIKKRVWYAISTSAEAAALVKWIKSSAEMVFYEREVSAAAAAKSKAAVAGGAVGKQRLKAVEVPMSPGMMKMMKKGPGEARRLGVVVKEGERWDFVRREEVTKERVEELCKEVGRVGGFWRLEEEGVGKLV